jgi:hypothetical protein
MKTNASTCLPGTGARFANNIATFARHSPAKPPKAPNSRLSSKSCRTICQLEAPMANRIAISLLRPAL